MPAYRKGPIIRTPVQCGILVDPVLFSVGQAFSPKHLAVEISRADHQDLVYIFSALAQIQSPQLKGDDSRAGSHLAHEQAVSRIQTGKDHHQLHGHFI